MGAEAKEPGGPDLRAGVPLERLVDEVPFLGQVDGDGVVLVRRRKEIFALGATCTHYGGPLAEGRVEGDTLRCPWHHAAFCLRTGEAVAAPALNPVACWRVESREGMVYVTGREEPGPLDSLGRRAAGPESVVIVGAGAAGSAAAEMLRRQGYTGPISLVDPDAAAPYDRPNLSKDYLAGNAPEEWIPLRPDSFYAEHGITRVVAEVWELDVERRTLTLSDGTALGYGALLLATGASPVRLSIPGADLQHVRLLRSLSDARALIERAKSARHVVILGASFIGMEAAASLRARGLQVTVVAPDAVPFERTLGPELGRFLHRLHEEKGVAFRLGRTAAAVEAGRVVLDDGSALEADLVVVGIGVRPDLRLAESAGLEVDRGVLVDACLRTSAPGVFAAGDIARWPDAATGERRRVEHWVVAQRQGQTAARNMLGQQVAFTDVPFFWTQHYDVAVAYVGHAPAWERIEMDGDPESRDCAVRYIAGGKTLALATIGRDQTSLDMEVSLRAGALDAAGA